MSVQVAERGYETEAAAVIHCYLSGTPLLLTIPAAGMVYLAIVHLARPMDRGAWKRALLALAAFVGIQVLGLMARSTVFSVAAARNPAFRMGPRDLLCDGRHPVAMLLGTAYLFGGVAVYYSIVVQSVPRHRRSLFRIGLILSLVAAMPVFGLVFG